MSSGIYGKPTSTHHHAVGSAVSAFVVTVLVLLVLNVLLG